MRPSVRTERRSSRHSGASASIAVRLAWTFALTAMAIFALMAAALYQVLDRELDRYQMEQMQGRLEDLRYMLEHGRSAQLALHVREKMADMQRTDGRTRYWLWSEDPEYRFGDAAQQVAQQAQSRYRMAVLDLPGSKGHVAVVNAQLPANAVRPAVQLMIGMDAAAIGSTLHTFKTALIALTLLSAVVVAALGYWIAVMGLKPLKQLSEDAHRIGRNQGAERLELPILPAELHQLGASINSALDRLSMAYRQLETFNADVAHELRTPVSNMIGQTQVALSRERSVGELREILQSNLEELERLRGIVADMLFLARVEQGERAHGAVEVSLAQEMGKIIEFFEMLLDDAGMRVSLQGDARAVVQTTLLRRALSNLLQNAIQHASGGKEIVVDIRQAQGGSALLCISNASEPIAEAQLQHLFDRFYRIDGARANSGESHGLGLAIVKAIAAMHGGGVSASCANGRICISLLLPRAA